MDQNSGEDPIRAPTDARQRADVDPLLRAKYLDYCSARLSEVFLSLTDERTYEIMEEAAGEADISVGTLSFQSMMRLVTHKLRMSVPLPDLESWVEEYRQHPERYDPFLLGLWESEGLDRRGPEGEDL